MQQFVSIDFIHASEVLLNLLSDAKEMSLATSSNDYVTSRVISTACFGRKIIFLSIGSQMKATQIADNPNIALCYKSCGMEGQATIIGSASDNNLAHYIEKYLSKLPEDFEVYPKMADMKIFEIEINRISYFGRDNRGFYIDRIDLVNETAIREYYPNI